MVILHGYPRTTGDIDIWVEKTPENYLKINDAFLHFGMPVFEMTEHNFLYHPVWDVYNFGTAPSSIDVTTNLKGLDFETTFHRAVFFE